MATRTIWYAEDGSVSVGGNEHQQEVREISITGGGRDAEQIRTFGNGTIFAQRPMEAVECSLTTIMKDHKFTEMIIGGSDASEPYSNTGDGTRYRQDVVYTWTDGTDVSGAQMKISMASAYAVTSEVSQATDNQLEQTVGFKCLSKDFKIEYTTDRATNALP